MKFFVEKTETALVNFQSGICLPPALQQMSVNVINHKPDKIKKK